MLEKLRLIFRFPIVDSDGKCAGYTYHTVVVDCPKEIKFLIDRREMHPEVTGCEWLQEEKSC
jgi:hypothetical protein